MGWIENLLMRPFLRCIPPFNILQMQFKYNAISLQSVPASLSYCNGKGHASYYYENVNLI